MSRTVFLSYSRADVLAVEALAGDIGEMGHRAWVDRDLSGGQRWWDEVLRNIRNADVVVMVVTQAALDSRACRSEFEYALALGKLILPVTLGNSVADAMLPPALAELQRVAYSPDDKRSIVSLARAFATLPQSIDPPADLPPPPPVPTSYLYDLVEMIGSDSSLPHEDQVAVVDEIEARREAGHEASDLLVLVERMSKRPDLSVVVNQRLRVLREELASTRRPGRHRARHPIATRRTPRPSRVGWLITGMVILVVIGVLVGVASLAGRSSATTTVGTSVAPSTATSGDQAIAPPEAVGSPLPRSCYVVDDAFDTLVRLNLPGGEQRTVGVLNDASTRGLIDSVEEIAMHPRTSELYASNYGWLGIIDVRTAVYTAVTGPVAEDIDAMAFDADGTLYVALRRPGPDRLATVDLASQVVDNIGAIAGQGVPDDIDGIVVDSDDPERLLALGNWETGDRPTHLIEIDRTSGAASIIGELGAEGPVEGLDFDATGLLVGSSGDLKASSYYAIDPATGAATQLGELGEGRGDYEALACATQIN